MKFFIIVTLLTLSITLQFYVDGAAIRSEEFAEQILRIVNDGYPEGQRAQRATEKTNDEWLKPICYHKPCGWNSYILPTRRGTMFVANACDCPDETYKCVRTGENVSMSAYVYYCRQNTTADDIIETDYNNENTTLLTLALREDARK